MASHARTASLNPAPQPPFQTLRPKHCPTPSLQRYNPSPAAPLQKILHSSHDFFPAEDFALRVRRCEGSEFRVSGGYVAICGRALGMPDKQPRSDHCEALAPKHHRIKLNPEARNRPPTPTPSAVVRRSQTYLVQKAWAEEAAAAPDMSAGFSAPVWGAVVLGLGRHNKP